jgi:hypothetical protein
MLNETGIRNLIIIVAGLALMIVGCTVLFGAKRANFSETAKTGANSLVGLVILAMGAGTFALVAFGQDILDTVFNVSG